MNEACAGDEGHGWSAGRSAAGGGRFLYGTSSWSEKSWRGVFYPKEVAPGDWLGWYSTRFPSVEADSTYYAVPTRERVRAWATRTASGFVISAKFPRSIVHGGEAAAPDPAKVLVWEHVGADAERFVDTMAILGGKLGVLALQFPYFNQSCFSGCAPFLERLEAFLARLPRELRVAVEIRNKHWIRAELLECLRRARAGFVLADVVYMPHPDELPPALDLVTADFVYVRLIGDRKLVESRTQTFDKVVVDQSARLARWARTIDALLPRVPEVMAYANNHFAGHGPTTIRELAALLRRERAPLAPGDFGGHGG